MKDFPFKLIDLTHSLDETTPAWDEGCGFKHETTLDYSDCTEAVKFRVQKLKMLAGIGTHIDSPSHCIENGNTVGDLPLENLIAPLVVIDIHKELSQDLQLLKRHIEEYENNYRAISEGDFVLIYTGWNKYWKDPEKYRNNYQFPSVAKEAAELLISKKIVGLGIDTLSPDLPSSGFPVHQLVLGTGRYIVENIAHAHLMPKMGAYVLTLPIKGKEMSEAPVRMVGLIER